MSEPCPHQAVYFDECEKDIVEFDFYHQENFFWVINIFYRHFDQKCLGWYMINPESQCMNCLQVSKMGFLIVSLSFMVASIILKYETILKYFYSLLEKRFGNKEDSVNSADEMVMDNSARS